VRKLLPRDGVNGPHDEVEKGGDKSEPHDAEDSEEKRDDGVHGRPPFEVLFGREEKKLERMIPVMEDFPKTGETLPVKSS
jgi:hypothetical protein